MNQKGNFLAEFAGILFVAALVIGALGGWILNVIKLFGMLDGPVTAMFVARIVGVFAAPLGSVLGWL